MVGCGVKSVTKRCKTPGVVLGCTTLTRVPVSSLCFPVKVETAGAMPDVILVHVGVGAQGGGSELAAGFTLPLSSEGPAALEGLVTEGLTPGWFVLLPLPRVLWLHGDLMLLHSGLYPLRRCLWLCRLGV